MPLLVRARGFSVAALARHSDDARPPTCVVVCLACVHVYASCVAVYVARAHCVRGTTHASTHACMHTYHQACAHIRTCMQAYTRIHTHGIRASLRMHASRTETCVGRQVRARREKVPRNAYMHFAAPPVDVNTAANSSARRARRPSPATAALASAARRADGVRHKRCAVSGRRRTPRPRPAPRARSRL